MPYNDAIETRTFTRGDITLTATIYPDDSANEPFDGDNGVRIVILHRNYSDPAKGACGRDAEAVAEWATENAADWFTVPLYMHKHSGVALSTGNFGDP